jgi:hypothetical protein
MYKETSFCLNNYLPKNIIVDMSLLDTFDSDDDADLNRYHDLD